MKRVGIVGSEAAKFTPEAEREAREIIRAVISQPCVVVSGACPLGGIDIWAEEEADLVGRAKSIFPPAKPNWAEGFKPRNIQIAHDSHDEMHCIVVARLPKNYLDHRGRGARSQAKVCHHCGSSSHVPSGGCWTAKYWQKLTGKKAEWHIVGATAAVTA